MKDLEVVAAEEELRQAQQRVQAVRLKIWERDGVEWWNRLPMFFPPLGLGYATKASIFLFLEGLKIEEFARRNDLRLLGNLAWAPILLALLPACCLLVLRYHRRTRPILRHFDRELVLGFAAGLLLPVVFPGTGDPF